MPNITTNDPVIVSLTAMISACQVQLGTTYSVNYVTEQIDNNQNAIFPAITIDLRDTIEWNYYTETGTVEINMFWAVSAGSVYQQYSNANDAFVTFIKTMRNLAIIDGYMPYLKYSSEKLKIMGPANNATGTNIFLGTFTCHWAFSKDKYT